VHDTKLLAATIEAIVVERPDPAQCPQHLCLDKAYDNPTGQAATEAAGYIPHIRRIGEEKLDTNGKKRHPARRWVVERTLAWLHRYRRLSVRDERYPSVHQAFLTLGCVLICWNYLKARKRVF